MRVRLEEFGGLLNPPFIEARGGEWLAQADPPFGGLLNPPFIEAGRRPNSPRLRWRSGGY